MIGSREFRIFNLLIARFPQAFHHPLDSGYPILFVSPTNHSPNRQIHETLHITDIANPNTAG